MFIKQKLKLSRPTPENSRNSRGTLFFPLQQTRRSPTFHLTSEQLNMLKFGLSHSISRPSISKTDVFNCFELIHLTMAKNLIDKTHDAKLVADLSHLARSYVSAHRPTTSDRKKYRILKDLKKKQTIVILKPDKGNGVVVLDRIAYDNGIL